MASIKRNNKFIIATLQKRISNDKVLLDLNFLLFRISPTEVDFFNFKEHFGKL